MRPVRSVTAINSAYGSGNPLHDRALARALGHKDALISGADAFAMLADLAVERLGESWISSGMLDCRLIKPIYDGDSCDLFAAEDDGGDLVFELYADNEMRASARCGLRSTAMAHGPDDIAFEQASDRPALTAAQLTTGRILPTILQPADSALLLDAPDRDPARSPIYAERRWLHPYFLIKLAIYTLGRNFQPEVLIHLGSRLQNFAPIADSAALQARSRVLANYETRGHKAAYLDIVILADGAVAAGLRHNMVYRLRDAPSR